MQCNKLALLLYCLLASTQAVASEQTTELPNDEMLDYLGQWQQVDGEWVDPMQLQEISMIEQDSSKGERDEK